MRDRKTLIYLNIKDLTPAEIEKLADYELNCCDNCGEIDLSIRLRWIDSEEFYDDKYCVSLVASGTVAICDDCYNKREKKLAQCGSCDKFFIVDKEDKDCPWCHSCNWVYGCIDDADIQCFSCNGNTDCKLEAYQDCRYNPANKNSDE